MKITGYKPTAWISVLVLGLWLPGCGGGSSGASLLTNDTPTTIQPSADVENLQAYLQAEFTRLGIDPHKVVAAAPQGSDNVVFDLDAEIIDPDGAGGDPPTSITLTWTEQLVGDYDQNGEVNASDLTPLGVYWEDSIEYDTPSLHGGFAYWPAGDPDAGGAANWRLSRVDGSRDGQIYQYDITPIAVHWKEQLSGCQVYRRAPGEEQFTKIINPGDPECAQTIPRHLAYTDNDHPVRYDFYDDNDGEPFVVGVYEYYVAAYDTPTCLEGPASGVLSVDIDTGNLNHAPVAVLTATPDSGGTPAAITLDASQSYDIDGDEIYDIYWDLDNDAQTDPDNHDFYSRDGTAQETSSSGAVIDIEPVPPDGGGIVTKLSCTYIKPHGTPEEPEYWYPYISVIDEHGLAGGGYAKLGISGWVTTVISSAYDGADPPAGTEIPFQVRDMDFDPLTGDLLVTGVANNSPKFVEDAEYGIYLGRIHNDGSWDYECLFTFSDERWEIPLPPSVPGGAGVVDICWDENNKPLLWISGGTRIGMDTKYWVYYARPDANGNWDLIHPELETADGTVDFEISWGAQTLAPGHLVAHCVDHEPPNDQELAISYVYYDDGEWSVETFEDYTTVSNMGWYFLQDTQGVIYTNAQNEAGLSGLWLAERTGQATWHDIRLDSGQFDEPNHKLALLKALSDGDDGLVLLAVSYEPYTLLENHNTTDYLIVKESGTGLSATRVLTEITSSFGGEDGFFRVGDTNYAVMSNSSPENNRVLFMEERNGSVVVEQIAKTEYYQQGFEYVFCQSAAVGSDHMAYVVLRQSGGDFFELVGGSPRYYKGQLLARRVDPRK